jgi:pimeloyl-ACP methyl ester carboxylesterase
MGLEGVPLRITRDDFERQYASLSDEELLSLDRDDLVETARGCYDEELARRRLTPVSTPAAGLEETEPLAAGTFTSRTEAARAREILKAAEIPCFLENEHVYGLETPFTEMRLMVPARFLDDARDLLSTNSAPLTAPEPWDGHTEHRFVETNGIRMHYVEAGSGPLVVLLHGFPESWYSWRHQLGTLAEEGYHAVAPDLRGYGQTDRPESVEAYDIFQLTGDIVGLVQALGDDRAVIVGHDWGAWIAPCAALLRPDLFRAVALLSVPFVPRRTVNESQWEQQKYPGKIFYQAMLRSPQAEQFFGTDIRGRLLAGLWTLSGDVRPADRWTPVRDPNTAPTPPALPWNLPVWLMKADLDFLEGEFKRTGFTGGLNYYRNMDRNWALTPFLDGAKLLQRTLFIAGEKDPVLEFLDEEYAALETNVPNLWKKALIPGAGHWIQQERPEDVNRLLIAFLRDLEAGARAGN